MDHDYVKVLRPRLVRTDGFPRHSQVRCRCRAPTPGGCDVSTRHCASLRRAAKSTRARNGSAKRRAFRLPPSSVKTPEKYSLKTVDGRALHPVKTATFAVEHFCLASASRFPALLGGSPHLLSTRGRPISKMSFWVVVPSAISKAPEPGADLVTVGALGIARPVSCASNAGNPRPISDSQRRCLPPRALLGQESATVFLPSVG